MDDPFAEFQTVAAPAVEVGSGKLFVYDLETVPDESRYPRPTAAEKPVRPDAEDVDLNDLCGGTVKQIEKAVAGLSESQLIALQSLEESSAKPRDGALKAIAGALQFFDVASGLENELAEWRKLSFSPWKCRIVALGIEAAGHSVTMVAKDLNEERQLLNVLWEHIKKYRCRCGYNITAFDDAVIVARSMILGVSPPTRIERKACGTRESVDLYKSIFPTYGDSMKLKELCKAIGIVPKAGYEMDGSQVLDLVDAGDWDGIANYVHSDAVVEFELYNRLCEFQIL